jgi:hypothetical protein
VGVRGHLGGLSQNGFTGEAEASEAKKSGFSLLLVHFYPRLYPVSSSIFTPAYKTASRYSISICVKQMKPKPIKALPNGPLIVNLEITVHVLNKRFLRRKKDNDYCK